MTKIITLTAASLMIMAALPAYASSDDISCRGQAGQNLSVRAITAKATQMGYTVRKVEFDDGCYEVKATSKNGTGVELKMHPVTGKVVKKEHKS